MLEETTTPLCLARQRGFFYPLIYLFMGSLKNRVLGEKVLHIPNIQDEAGIRGLAGIDKYKLRMLSPLMPGDSAIMPANTRNDSAELFRLYDQLGVPHMRHQDIVHLEYEDELSLSKAIFREQAAVRRALQKLQYSNVEPFIFSRNMDSVAEVLGVNVRTKAEASEIVNNKYLSQAALRERGVSVPAGKLVHSLAEATAYARELKERGYQQVSFKLQRAASGMGVFKVDVEDLPEYAKKFATELAEEGILIDGWIEGGKASPNIQYFVGDNVEQDVFVSSTDQILEDLAHKGNATTDVLDGNQRLAEDMLKIRNWTREQGFRGIIGVDFLIANDGTPYYMETNGRINGSTPGALMVDKLVGSTTAKPWGVQNNVKVPKTSSVNDFVAALDREGLTYDHQKKWGVLPTNTSPIADHGKIMVMLIGETNEQVREMLSTLYHLDSQPKSRRGQNASAGVQLG